MKNNSNNNSIHFETCQKKQAIHMKRKYTDILALQAKSERKRTESIFLFPTSITMNFWRKFANWSITYSSNHLQCIEFDYVLFSITYSDHHIYRTVHYRYVFAFHSHLKRHHNKIYWTTTIFFLIFIVMVSKMGDFYSIEKKTKQK